MGREATCACRAGADSGHAKALLESDALILRGALKRRWPIGELRGVRVDGAALRFDAGGEAVALELGAVEAAKWAAKIAAPPPSLAAKLGIGPDARALVFGKVDDELLAAALAGASTRDAMHAALLVAVVRNHAALAAAIELHATLSCRLMWVVHPKGPGAVPSDSDVRTAMHARGWRDSKSCAVSATLTATRYGKPEG